MKNTQQNLMNTYQEMINTKNYQAQIQEKLSQVAAGTLETNDFQLKMWKSHLERCETSIAKWEKEGAFSIIEGLLESLTY